LPLYQIRINEEDFTKQVDRICSRYGKLVETDEITGSEMLKADLTELNKQGEPFEGGLHIEGASMALEFVKEEKIKKKFKGCKPGDQLVIEIKKAFENDTDLAALLKVEKERLSSLQRDFRITIRTVSRFEKAEVNQELFDKVYGQDLVHSEEEFKKRIEDEMKAAFERNAQYKFRLDARNYYLAKFKSSLPEAFLKRWLLQSNQGKVTLEQIEKDFDHFIIDLKWQLIKGRIGKDHSLTFTEEDLLTHATVVMRQQFVQYYGVTELPTDLIEKYAKESLGKEEERGRYAESMMEEKVYDFIRQKIKLENKEITSEKFQKLLADN
jgi:trigger factor